MKTFTLTVTEDQVNLLGAALSELPFKVSAALIQELQQQVNEQNQPVVEPLCDS